jgi:hypothetical protein
MAKGEPVPTLLVEFEDDLRVPIDEVQGVVGCDAQTVCVFEDAVAPGVDQPTSGVEDHIRVLRARKHVHVIVRVNGDGADLTPSPAGWKLAPAVYQLVLALACIDNDWLRNCHQRAPSA